MYSQKLYSIIKPIKSNTIQRLNKSKKWLYGYNKEHDVVVISKNGTIGDIYEIQGLKIALPKTPIKNGDEIIVHHNVFRRWHDARGKEKNSTSYISEDLYKVNIDQVFAYKSKNEWRALPGYTFIKPIQKQDGSEANQIGIVKYSDGSFKKGDLMSYNPKAEYEFVIEGERLYRVPNIFIEIKYERQGNEREYNPSWS